MVEKNEDNNNSAGEQESDDDQDAWDEAMDDYGEDDGLDPVKLALEVAQE